MSAPIFPIFNKQDDSYIFTGSQFRAGSAVSNLRLSKGLTSVIDISQGGIDICASNVFINSTNLRVSSLSLAEGASLTVPETLTFNTLTGSSGTFSSTLGVTGALTGSSGTFSSTLGVNGALTGSSGIFSSTLGVTGAFSAASGRFKYNLDVSGALTASGGTFLHGLSVTGGDLDVTNNLTLGGNLTVRGTTTTIQSNTVDISDRNITLAAGNTLGGLGATGAGFDICGTNATFRYDYNPTTFRERFISNVGLTVSGNILPYDISSVLPVSYNSFSVKSNRDTSFSSYLDTCSNEVPLNEYTTGITLISLKSYVKVDIRLNYIASKEASQTLKFRVTRLLYPISQGATEEKTISTETIGSDMGVGLKGAYVASIIDLPLDGRVIYSGSRIMYRVHMTRNVLDGDTISEDIGVVAAPIRTDTNEAVSSYVLLQELYVPP